VFESFLALILDEKKNILSARPYFRERQKSFSNRVSPALKKRSAERLQKFNYNYLFVQFAMKVYKGRSRKELASLADQIRDSREKLIERNMPLAINRAKMFWGKVPKADRELMDFVQLAAEGLISAVDKFVLPYRTVFRSVIIGRVTGNMTEASSDTMMHFYPSDKRILYKANLIILRHKIDDLAKVAEIINQDKKSVVRATDRRIKTGLEVWVRDAVEGCPPGAPYRIEVTSLPEIQRCWFLDKRIGEKVELRSTHEVVEIVEMFEVVTESRLHCILRGSSHISMDATLSGSPGMDPESANLEAINVHSRIADTKPDAEEELSKRTLSGKIREAFEKCLTPLERKIFVLKGEIGRAHG
jgi:hypothetical protein